MLQINQLTKTMFGEVLIKEASIQINDGQKVALVGNNGTGKSTLLKLIAGLELPDKGSISLSKNQKISYLEQHSIVDSNEEVFDYIYNGQKDIKNLAKRLAELESDLSRPKSTGNMESLLERYGRLQEEFMEKDGYVIEEKIKSIATGLKVTELLGQPVNTLSGGQQTLVKLARCLLENNEVLLLDEPTNHLDTTGLSWLENYLKHSDQTVIIVSHDRYFLDQVVERVVLIESLNLCSYQGNYTKFKELKEIEQLALEKNYHEQQKEIKQTEDAIRRFRHWGAISDNEKHFKKAKRLENQLEKMDKIQLDNEANKAIKKGFSESQKSGKEVVLVKDLWKIFDEQIIFSDLNESIYRGERVAITGGNGVGKTTLLKIILGEESFDEGEVRVGESVEIGYLSQVIDFTRPNESLLDYFRSRVTVLEQDARRILSYFKFYKDDVFKKVGHLSGGEKVRLELACLMNGPINCLILDEPTNHLDINTREWLENQLENFNGTLIMVSHDRYFVEKLATRKILLTKVSEEKK